MEYQSLPTGVAVLPDSTIWVKATIMLPNDYQRLPTLTVRSVDPTMWHIVPDPHAVLTTRTVSNGLIYKCEATISKIKSLGWGA